MNSLDSQKWSRSRKMTVLVIAVALGLDNIILTVIVPILPTLLYEIDNTNQLSNNTEFSYHHTTGNSLSNETKQNISITNESAKVGYMLASKSIVQLIVNPIVGPLTHKVGYIKPMFFGLIVMFISTLLFAFGNTYLVLFIARAIQGIGSSCSSVAGLALLAETFTNDDDRAKAMALAFTGLSFGIIAGPPFGAIMYQLVNKTAPFLIICFFTLLDGCLLLYVTLISESKVKKHTKPPSILALVKDQYILLVAVGIFLFQIGIAFIETGLPIWMLDTMDASRWETGLAMVPLTGFYLLGINIYRPVLKRTRKWLVSVVSLFFYGASFVGLSMVHNKIVLILPLAAAGLFCGTTEIFIFPELGHIVDVRYASDYGNVYAIADFALCLGFGIGPILCGLLMSHGIRFDHIAFFSGIACILYSPFLGFLKYVDKEEAEEKEPLLKVVKSYHSRLVQSMD